MSKQQTLSLEAFRTSLDSEAQQRCKAQEATIKNLHGQVKQLRELLTDREEDLRVLANRCWALSRGSLCLFCGMRGHCWRDTGRK